MVSSELAPRTNGVALSQAASRLIYTDREGKPYRPEQIELLVAICAKHGLVPELRHVVFIRDAAYITNAGLLHKAHSLSDLNGIETRPATDAERAAYTLGQDDGRTHVWRCEVFRRGHARPYVGWGKASLSESNMAAKNSPQEMAATRATNRALRLAYDVGMTSIEEMPEERADPITGEIVEIPRPKVLATPEAPKISWPQVRDALMVRGWEEEYAAGWARDQIKAFGKASLRELTQDEWKALLAVAQRGESMWEAPSEDDPQVAEPTPAEPADDERPF